MGLSWTYIHEKDRGSEAGVDLSAAVWRKSSRSSDNGGQCVEVASNLPGTVAVRDSKDPAGSALLFAPAVWRSFIEEVKAGGFGPPA
ncbi:DUF397 domain-containing protein [Streptosporangium sp. NPDC004379]|uniref:DUF397 domain-containing protein n=1 Tax=Streptosporangium sp. NPDC004379 TaxID=3366189 RepID=UPI003676EF0B